jgi:hypothetical protein
LRELPPRARLLVLAVLLAAGIASVISAAQVSSDWFDIGVFFVIFGLASAFATSADNRVSYSVGFIVGLAAVALTGTAGGTLVGLAGVAVHRRGASFSWVKRAFNASQFALSALASGVVFHAIADISSERISDVAVWRLLVAASCAALVYYIVNVSLVAAAVSLTSGLSLPRVWAGSFSPMAVVYLGYGLVGVLVAQLYEQFGPLSVVFVLTPLVVARSAFANYAQLREAYDSTVRAFAQAVETKDYYTRGHSERVARVAEMIAREHGMREDRVQVIRIAGMLHDVGKLGVPTRVLQKQGKLNQLEFEAIKLHPLRGYEMLCEIDFLKEALDGVYHHHERLDGRGYPMGLIGDEIPEFARIVMVADAFDSMTSTRSYRQAKSVEDAVAELRRCEGVQFDPHMVDCLVRAIGKHGWEPHPEDYFGEQVDREGNPVPLRPLVAGEADRG